MRINYSDRIRRSARHAAAPDDNGFSRARQRRIERDAAHAKPSRRAVVLHADDREHDRERAVVGALGGARFRSLREFHQGLSEQHGYTTVSFAMLQEMADELGLERVSRTVVVDRDLGLALLRAVDNEFPADDGAEAHDDPGGDPDLDEPNEDEC